MCYNPLKELKQNIRKSVIMEFNEKLQELRKQKGLTQEQLADCLYVSRTAISKWESGRGYPNINSLKAIAKLFSVTIDQLLSGDELLDIAEADSKQKETHIRDLVSGLLDLSVSLFFFLPFFGQKANGIIHEVSLFTLYGISPYLKTAYFISVFTIVIWGILTLTLQNCNHTLWLQIKSKISILLSVVGALLFIISQQPYAAIFLFVFLLIKVLMLIKWQ